MKFLSGSTTGDKQCVNITIIDDNYKEENESFVFAICAGGEESVHIDDFYANVYIIDDESKLFAFFQLIIYFGRSCSGVLISWEWWCGE